jgi:hypothetical protein
MPRLSLYKPEKGRDYKFLDRQIYEMFQIGGTDVLVHKYIGTDDGTTVKDERQIQDLLFLENRDRKYDQDIYSLRGIYNVQDIDFDLSQFGLFLQNDTVFMTIHINSSVDSLGRKIMPGDVIELPHLKDEYAANDYEVALKRFYVVEDVNRAAEGFSPTWYPHLYRVKLKQIVDSQEFKEILDLPMNEDAPDQGSLRDLLSTYDAEMQINNANLLEAEKDAPKSGYDITNFYTLSTENGTVDLATVDDSSLNAGSLATVDALRNTPRKDGYSGYLLGSTEAPDGAPFGSGITFPLEVAEGDYFLRVDFMPNRLFRYDGERWVKMRDNMRMNLTSDDARQTQKTSFINNNEYTYIDQIATDLVSLAKGDTVVLTDVESQVDNPRFIMLKINGYKVEFDSNEHPNMYDTHTRNNIPNLVKLNLPIEIIDAGLWEVIFYNDRVKQRQSLSEALRARSDN